MLFMSAIAIGQTVTIENQSYGSGTPGVNGYEKAIAVDNDYLHAPQYMAAFPTAATIWPRVVEVPCVKEAGVLKCQGYTWQPKMGRGEYLFFKPIIQEVQVPVPPQIVKVPVPYPVYVEVKKKKE